MPRSQNKRNVGKSGSWLVVCLWREDVGGPRWESKQLLSHQQETYTQNKETTRFSFSFYFQKENESITKPSIGGVGVGFGDGRVMEVQGQIKR